MTKIVEWDGGHGGRDPGSSGNGVVEKTIALQVVTEAAKRLEREYEGIKCLLTRSSDVYLSLKERTNKLTWRAQTSLLVSTATQTVELEVLSHTHIPARKMPPRRPYRITEMSRIEGSKERTAHVPRVAYDCCTDKILFIDVAAVADQKSLKLSFPVMCPVMCPVWQSRG